MTTKNVFYDFLYKNYTNFKDNNKEYIMSGDKILNKQKTYTNGKKIKQYPKDNCKLHTHLLPQPVCGDLNRASIFICSCNPGFDDEDYVIDNKYFDTILNQLDQKNKKNELFWLKQSYANTPGGKWWQSKIDRTVDLFIKEFGKNGINATKDKIYDFLSKQICSLELLPYHSVNANKGIFKKCKSVNMMKKYVHNYLIPYAISNDKIILFTRSIKDWGITNRIISAGQGHIVVGNNPLSFSFNPNTIFGKEIYSIFKKITNGFSILK